MYSPCTGFPSDCAYLRQVLAHSLATHGVDAMFDIAGAIDIHVHAGPELFTRLGDAFDIARRARDAGMGGIVLKCHHESTVARAYFTRKVVEDIGVWGGITLNQFVGGINPVAVAAALDSGAKIVWMPTMHADHHIKLLGAGTYGVPTMTLSKGATVTDGITVLDANGELTADTRQIIQMIALREAVLATAHLSEIEIAAVVRACQEFGTRCVVTHAFFPRHSIDFLVEMAGLGAVIEVSAVVAYPMARHLMPGMSLAMARDLIKAVGAERMVLSTDSGQIHNPWPPDILRAFINSLIAVGISADDLRYMVVDQPQKLLGLH
jgi:hypothetical protein